MHVNWTSAVLLHKWQSESKLLVFLEKFGRKIETPCAQSNRKQDFLVPVLDLSQSVMRSVIVGPRREGYGGEIVFQGFPLLLKEHS